VTAALWILVVLAVLLLLLVLLCLSRVGVTAQLREGEQVLHVRVGLLRFRIYPARQKAKKKKSRQRKLLPKAGKLRRKPFPNLN